MPGVGKNRPNELKTMVVATLKGCNFLIVHSLSFSRVPAILASRKMRPVCPSQPKPQGLARGAKNINLFSNHFCVNDLFHESVTWLRNNK